MDAGILQITGRGDHLLSALYQQPGEADSIGMVFGKGSDELFWRNFNAQIHHLITVIAENDFNQVFSDVVHISLDRR